MAINEPTNAVVAAINDYPDAKYNRLFPATITQLSPLHKVMVNTVQINPDENSGDVYKQKTGGGLSLTKISCLKLMATANAIMEESKPILPKACQRCMEIAKRTKLAPQCGPCPSRDDAAYQVSVLIPEPSGGYRRYIATKEINRQQFVAKNGGEGKAPVEHMGAQCETKALLRALRAGLGIKGSYTQQELKKPFAVAVVVLNTTDPELKAALIQRYAAGESALFSGVAPSPALSVGQPDLKLVEGGHTVDMNTGEVVQHGPSIATTTVIEDEKDDDAPPTELFGAPAGGMPSFEEAIDCEGDDCGQIIEQFTDANGKTWSPQELAELGVQNTGRKLCASCLKKSMQGKAGA